MPKKIYVDGFVFLQNGASPPIRKTCPIPILWLIGENIIIFEKIHITEYNFCKYLEPRKEFTRFAWSKLLQKCWTGVTFGISRDFHGLIISSFFLFHRLLSKKWDIVKKNICWQITLAATSLKTNPPPFQEEIISPKLKDYKIVIAIIKSFGVFKNCTLISKRKKFILIHFLPHAFQKKLVLFILVTRLYSIITYVGCWSSLSWCSNLAQKHKILTFGKGVISWPSFRLPYIQKCLKYQFSWILKLVTSKRPMGHITHLRDLLLFAIFNYLM